jgi:methylenetetrahydrofolate--tRNA-(uracil-5-)-methyltransferase
VTYPAVTVIGAGLAGSEAAWQLATRGVPVRLVEMRPVATTPAHETPDFAELVCSNSLKSDDPETAAGLLKRELEALGSLVLACARDARVPAGAALAVDRAVFSRSVTERVSSHPLIAIERREADSVPATGHVIVATGPLTSPALEKALSALLGSRWLHFYDAAAPVVEAASIRLEHAFAASRYDKGSGADYLNCPMDRETYEAFARELVAAQRVTRKDFERAELFQACQPVEEIARTGLDALRFGAFKPVGLTDPSTGARPWAVLQLRAENRQLTAYNLVGCQTNLTFGEQRRVFGMIPALSSAEFVRYGVMHRNTFADAPRLLTPTLALRTDPRVRLAGQLSGTEGYLEAAGGGLLAALGVFAESTGSEPPVLPSTTALGALIGYATDPATQPYQPMHVNFGLVPPLPTRIRGKRDRYAAYAGRATEDLGDWLSHRADLGLPGCASASASRGPKA